MNLTYAYQSDLSPDEVTARIKVMASVIAELEYELAKKESSITYLLGVAVLAASKSWRSALILPARLFSIHKEAVLRKTVKTRTISGERNAVFRHRQNRAALIERFMLHGFGGVEMSVRASPDESRQHAVNILWLAQILLKSSPRDSIDLSRLAYSLSPSVDSAMVLALALDQSGQVKAVAELSLKHSLTSAADVRPHAAKRFRAAAGLERLYRAVLSYPDDSARPSAVDRQQTRQGHVKLAYVLHCCFPYDVNGYSRRSHEIAVAAGKKNGFQVSCVTRPGYPWDRYDGKHPEHANGEAVSYTHLRGANINENDPFEFNALARSSLAKFFEDERISIVQGASNFTSALPAFFAAKQLGLPFIYEVRGLWELTALSKNSSLENSERLTLFSAIEDFLICRSDAVVTISETLKNAIVTRTCCSPDKVSVIRNCVDVLEFTPRHRNDDLLSDLRIDRSRVVVGFIGSIVGYEGLDDLIHVGQILRARAINVHFLIVGAGDERSRLIHRVESFGLTDSFTFPGRVDPTEINDYYSLIDIAVYPRRPYQVCEIVPPLKPLEAMACGIPVLVSSVAAMTEFVRHDENGYVFEKGNPDDLTEKLVYLATSEPTRRRLGEAGRVFVNERRRWDHEVGSLTALWDSLLSNGVVNMPEATPL